jgi:hypothetical protein
MKARTFILTAAAALAVAAPASARQLDGTGRDAPIAIPEAAGAIAPRALRALGARGAAMARAYQVDPAVRRVHSSAPSPAPVGRADDKAGVRGVGGAISPVPATGSPSQFDWADFGFGAAAAAGLLVILLGGVAAVLGARRHAQGALSA